MDQSILELLERVKRDRAVSNLQSGKNGRNGADRPGGAERFLPISFNELIFAAVEHRGRRQNSATHALSRDFSVFKESHRGVDAAHVKGLALNHVMASSDHALCRGASDIHDQSCFVRRRKRKAAALKHESRFFFASKNFNFAVQNPFRALNKFLRIFCCSKRLSADRTDMVSRQPADLFRNAGQGIQSPVLSLRRQIAVFIDTGRQTYRFFPAALGNNALAFNSGNFQTEAVASQVYRCKLHLFAPPI